MKHCVAIYLLVDIRVVFFLNMGHVMFEASSYTICDPLSANQI